MLRAVLLTLVLAIAPCADAGPMLAAAGTGKTLENEMLSRLGVEETPEHELVQARGIDAFTTPDPIAGVSFEEARLHTRWQGDLVDGSGLIRGYGILEATTGERLYVIFGYRIPPADGEPRAFEGTFEWTGGTGPLARIRGSGSVRGEIDRDGKAEYRWEVSYRDLEEES